MKFFSFVLILGLSFCFTNCYSLEKPYNYGNPYLPSPEFTEDDPQFEEGEPVWILDQTGNWIFSLPSKLVLWNLKADNHHISKETKEYLIRYIKENNLRDVKVRFNQYAPLSEWKRLPKNKNINPVIRYFFGSISLLAYTFLPGRLLAGTVGGDHYNSFTNTINVYSDLPAVVIHEGGHAKDFAQREKRTLYATMYAIPVVGSLYHEARASDDALNYFAEKNDKEQLESSYELLTPAYSTYVGGAIGDVVANPITALTVIPGHIYGRYKKRDIDSELEKRKQKIQFKEPK
ncbi:hypothetical protein [Leptospira kanakyensis]|uniref:Uncharacterized protein n=1 Tax=Leptospira kanakyensis TaxID=2484968 RepID=A0A6N4Q699_9LEPT|nr:hypothetical protein [Leptospira kanakyensis]MCW7470812.1 hypothetical protein [Leptospira kanakyensis]TGK54507.1 hypothetical protein EHQ11_02825 [Leptospira kanakyensis]TGK59025.1 hypothetical protein EHQ16_11790 [Leptospira kanakyensis]TGK75176.1 hypothetical protein EHQ18_02465 [Leptospira kanakyensis]